MKVRVALMIDEDVACMLRLLPRQPSISQFVTWVVRSAIENIKSNNAVHCKELQAWLETEDGKYFKQRLLEASCGGSR